MRRLALILAALICAAGSLVPAEAAVYGGESLVAAAGVRVRGTDEVLYQVEVQVARHDLQGAKVDYVLRFRLATCGEAGCDGPWYPLPVDPKDVVFTDDTASVRGTFGSSAFVVQWKARRAKKGLDPMTASPAADNDSGTVVASVHRDVRSAPAVVHLPGGLSCKTAASTIANQVGVVVTQDEDSEAVPSQLPKGFWKTATRKPKCF